jgi:hypothetical protein
MTKYFTMLLPESYAEGMEVYMSAVDTMEKGRDLESVREDLAEAKNLCQGSVEASQGSNARSFCG